jgi:D-alanyl-D-alanine carboxypeptidase/D-alanyl-D-alanine-endopeptidase (penicillin-binding protein 4)
MKSFGKSILKAPVQNQIFEYKSPTLDKIVYWFLRKSINLWRNADQNNGKEKRNNPTFETGVDFLKDFWKSKGINPMMINFADGSGLSPRIMFLQKPRFRLFYMLKNKVGSMLFMKVSHSEWHQNEKRNNQGQQIFCRLSDF